MCSIKKWIEYSFLSKHWCFFFFFFFFFFFCIVLDKVLFFNLKVLIYLLFLHENIYFRYSLEFLSVVCIEKWEKYWVGYHSHLKLWTCDINIVDIGQLGETSKKHHIALDKALFFNQKVAIFFLFLDKNICCGYSLEVPRWGTSNEYPQHMFLSRNKKTICLIPSLI